MTTRVGHLPAQGDSIRFEETLAALERACERPPIFPDTVLDGLRRLAEARPVQLPSDVLSRYLTLLYRLWGLNDPVDIAYREEGAISPQRIGWSCETQIFDCFHDSRAEVRDHILRSVDHARVLHPEEVAERGAHFRPQPWVPLDIDAARCFLTPYLDHLAKRAEGAELRHLKPCWDAVTLPLPPFEGLFWEWLDLVGQGEDFRLALALHGLTDRARQRVSGQSLRDTLLPLLQSDHPLVAAHAARFIGSLMADFEERVMAPDDWTPARIVEHLRHLQKHRRSVAGAFLNGIDAMDPDPFAELVRIAPDLDVEQWVMDVLRGPAEAAFLPGTQAFWFYLHEHYDRDPAMVLRFVRAGHLDVAWMCITENSPPADGMEPALEAMALQDPEGYGTAARDLLRRMGGG
ncbi:hypothetical protein BOO69_01895 [Sulfitobacter alexandrii]|uniref:Uncharacterized protein n=1 Tax=Sulfitobacter alexandrii TaxID=1917485 RepID=A0A1J0WDA5_9RHOB|nr:hypothetical protein [Sulfitobacter alexandrii]APE42301.1 hypothetical protein BOO69_01895 [Sulfitobacter alexandrii]